MPRIQTPSPQPFPPVLLRRLADRPIYPDPIVEIASGLLEMRRAGVLTRLYVDRGVIRIGTGGVLARIDYHEAVRIVERFREQRKLAKPAGKETRAAFRKSA